MTDVSAPAQAAPPAPKAQPLWEAARRRFARDTAAMAGLYLIIALALLAILGPLLWVHDYDAIYPDRAATAPTFAHLHLLGADAVGRDMLARLIAGLGVSLFVAFAATVLALSLGLAYGAVAGLVGGYVDAAMMGLVGVLSAIPFVFFIIVLMVVVRVGDATANLTLLILVIGGVEWLSIARIVRSEFAVLGEVEFVDAARAAGAPPARVVFRHIAPNALGPIASFATLNFPAIVLTESFLSFIGLGVQEPLTSLGKLIEEGADQMVAAPWMLVAPALTLMITLLALNLIGRGLQRLQASDWR